MPVPYSLLADEINLGAAGRPLQGECLACETLCEYRPRNAEESLLYGVVAGHLETFLARQRERDRTVPWFVEMELRSFLDCGILARG